MPRAQLHNLSNRNELISTFSSAFISRLQVVLQAIRSKEFNVLMSRESQLSDRSTPSESVSILSIEKVPQDGNATRR